jgi:hypothetical protein
MHKIHYRNSPHLQGGKTLRSAACYERGVDTKDCSVWRLCAPCSVCVLGRTTSTVLGQQYSQRIAPALKRDSPLVPSRRNRTILPPVPDGLRNIQIGSRRLEADGAYCQLLRTNKSKSNSPPGGSSSPSHSKIAFRAKLADGHWRVIRPILCCFSGQAGVACPKNRCKYRAYQGRRDPWFTVLEMGRT